MNVYIAVYESREAYKIEIDSIEEAVEVAYKISRDKNIELLDLYYLGNKKLYRIEI